MATNERPTITIFIPQPNKAGLTATICIESCKSLKDLISLLNTKYHYGTYYNTNDFVFFIGTDRINDIRCESATNSPYIAYISHQKITGYSESDPMIILPIGMESMYPIIIKTQNGHNRNPIKLYREVSIYHTKIVPKQGDVAGIKEAIFTINYQWIRARIRKEYRSHIIKFDDIENVYVQRANRNRCIIQFAALSFEYELNHNDDITSQMQEKEKRRLLLLIDGYTRDAAKVLPHDISKLLFLYRYDIIYEHNTMKCEEMVAKIKYIQSVNVCYS